MEVSLTLMLTSLLFMTAFRFINTQRYVCRRIQNNTSAVFMLETMRNHVKSALQSGLNIHDIDNKMLEDLFDSKRWEICLEIVDAEAGKKLVIAMFDRENPQLSCTYTTEVRP